MRFSLVSVAAALASPALCAPTGVANSLVNQVGGLVAQLQNGLPVSQAEKQFRALFGGSLVSIEDALGNVKLSDKLLKLANSDHLAAGSVQAVAEGLAMIKNGMPVDAVNAYLTASTGGAVIDIDATLGINDIVKVVADKVQ